MRDRDKTKEQLIAELRELRSARAHADATSPADRPRAAADHDGHDGVGTGTRDGSLSRESSTHLTNTFQPDDGRDPSAGAHSGALAAERRRAAAQYAVGRLVAETDNLDDIIPRILAAIGGSLGWEFGACWRPRDDRLRCVATWHPGPSGGEFERESRRVTMARGEGLPGSVLQADRPLWVEDVQQSTNFPRLEVAAYEGMRGAFAFPVRDEQGIWGIFEFFTRVREEPDSGLLQALDAIRDQIGQCVRRLRAAEALRESEARKGAMLEAALDAIVSIDAGGRIIEFNPAAEAMFGYPREQVLGAQMVELIVPPALRARHREGLRRYLGGGEPRILGRRVELSALRVDGTEFPIELTITRVALPDAPSFTAYIRDISERKRGEAEVARLLASEREARQSAEAASARIQFLSEGTARLAGSLDFQATLRLLAEVFVPALADWCVIHLPADGTLRQAAIAAADGELEAALRELAAEYTAVNLNAPYGVGHVLRTGEPELIPHVTDDILAALAAGDARHLELLRRLRPASELAVPLEANGRILGVVLLVSTGRDAQGPSTRHPYTADDLSLARELAHRAALAIDNARLYAESQRALGQVAEIATQLGQQAGELHAVVDAIPGAVLVCDAEGQIMRGNASSETLFGLPHGDTSSTAASLAALGMLRTLDGVPLPAEDFPLARALRGETRTDARYLLRGEGPGQRARELTIQCSYAPIRDRDGATTGAVVVAADISALYQLERQKDEFLSVASHELKTPLTTLKILTQLTRKRLEKLDLLDGGHILRMERAIGRMERLIGDLLDVSRIELGKLALRIEPGDLAAVCRQTAEDHREAAERRITLDLPDEPVVLPFDADRIEQVLANLLSNALKYSPPRRPVVLRLRTGAGEARVTVEDAGAGIPPEALPHIFGRFYRVPGVQVQSGSGVGLGIGLFISDEIVERHGGRMWAESEPGRGSRFTFALPLIPLSAPPLP